MIKASSSLGRVKFGVVGLVLCILAGAYYFGVFTRAREPKILAQTLVDMGVWGYLIFIITYAALQPFGIPGTIFIVAAPMIWPWPTAFALSMIGTMSASVVGFSFARFVARDWLAQRIPTRFRRYSDALERHAFLTVVILRLVLWMPQLLHSFFGVSKVSFWTHFFGSFIGYIPSLLVVSYLGASMFDPSGKMLPSAWPIMAGFMITSLVIAALYKIWMGRRAAQDPSRQG